MNITQNEIKSTKECKVYSSVKINDDLKHEQVCYTRLTRQTSQ